MNDYQVSLDDIPSALKRITTRDPNVPVIIRGDKDIPYQYIIEVMDRVRLGGATEISLSVEQKR